ncbi:MAG: thioredoxin fold domain-containing protein [Sulfurovum sp.]|nr:thioredoxin fold domain-containing protein [Sulfurovum sp.]
MKMIKLFTLSLLATLTLQAQSFYVLTGVDSYDPIVANMSTKVDKKYNAQIKESMFSMSKELGVNTKEHTSRILALVFTDFSLEEKRGVNVKLVVGEYIVREGATTAKVYATTYEDHQVFVPSSDALELEEQIIDISDEMLEKFALQYKDDNKKISSSKNVVEHEGFAGQMKYETNYEAAVKKARESGKEVMIFMTTNFCPWCRKLENRILSKDDINAKIHSKYVPVLLNLDTDKFPESFSKSKFTPILYVVNPKDESIKHQFIGYSNRDGFLQLLKDK